MSTNEQPAGRPAARSPTDLGYYALAVAAGLAIGALGTAFHLSADALLGAHFGLQERFSLPVAILLSMAGSIVMVLVALALVRNFAPEAAGSGVQEIEGAMSGLRELRWARILPVKFVAGVLSIGSGLVLGREGPTIHIGASVGAAIAELRRLPATETRGLYAAGAAAGLATAFNAPLAAVLFVVEETRKQFPYTFRTYLAVILACFCATVVTQEIAGVGPDLRIVAPEQPPQHLFQFLILGLFLGVCGVVFNRVLLWSLDCFQAVARRSPYLLPTIVAGTIGALLVVMPDVTRGGETLIIHLVGEHRSVLGLLILVAMRFATTMTSYPAGVPGGVFAPILTLATCIGLAAAAVLNAVLPGPDAAADALAIAAMGGLFASTVGAPLVGIVLVAELTGSYTVILPTIATCALSCIVARALGGRPIYEQLLERTLRLEGHAGAPKGDDTPLALGWEDRTTPPADDGRR